jgi:inhibitor of cysteine peptidase
MLRTIMVAAALAACAQGDEPQRQGQTPQRVLPAPTPENVMVRIGAGHNNRMVEVGVNQRFAVELIGVPTAGYLWGATQIPDFIESAGGGAGGPTQPEQNQPGFAGGNHWEVLMFVANAPGSGELVLEQRRPWETDRPPADVFRVTIIAR